MASVMGALVPLSECLRSCDGKCSGRKAITLSRKGRYSQQEFVSDTALQMLSWRKAV